MKFLKACSKFVSVTFPLALLFTPHYALARPSRRDAQTTPSDIDILNFALLIEHAESAFYRTCLAQLPVDAFTRAGYQPWVRERFEQIAQHEATHVAFLSNAIGSAGAKAVQACQYDFPCQDVGSFVSLAGVMENMGGAAYLGVSPFLNNKAYLTVAASMMSVEARHAAWISSAALRSNPWGTAFDTPLDINQVYSFVQHFVKTCPATNPALPVRTFAYLMLPVPQPGPGAPMELSFPQTDGDKGEDMYCAFVSGNGAVFVKVEPGGHVIVPVNMANAGTVYVFVTREPRLSDETTVAGPAVMTFAFDSKGRKE